MSVIRTVKRNIPILAAVLLLCACMSGPVYYSETPLEIPEDIAGLVHAGDTCSPEEYALIERMGASWILRTFSWSSIEPEQDRWDFDLYDEYVDAAKAADKKVLGVLAYDVRWIHKDGKGHRYIPRDKMPLFVNFVRQTAAHYKGRVDAWSVWNEPNLSNFWKGNKAEFFELTRQAAAAIREADPDVTILGGALNRGIPGFPTSYTRGLFESGAMENVDAIAVHPYETNPTRVAIAYNKFRAIAAEFGFADRIWVTEIGYPTAGWYPTKVSEEKFPEYIVKTFVNLTVGGAKTILWYQLFDPVNRKKSDSENYFGLMRSRSDYTSKGAEAFALCGTYLPGTVYRPDLLREGLPDSLRTFCFVQPAGGGALVLWSEKSSVQLTLQIPGGGEMHDLTSWDASAIPEVTVITVGETPVFVTWQGDQIPHLIRGR